jgi:hypothetical protein
MNTRWGLPFCAAGCWLTLAAAAAPAPGKVIDAATRTLAMLHAHLGRGYAPLMDKSKAILIAPAGATGDAVLLLRWGDHWSEPAFFDAAALPGKAPTVLLIMSDHALYEVLRQRGLTLDGPMAVSLATLGAKTPAELLLWPGKAKLDAAGFAQDDAANQAWYGRNRNAAEIVGGSPPDVRTARLRAGLGAAGLAK